MVRHNNRVPASHSRKKWAFLVATSFKQAGRKTRRHKIRAEKNAYVFPRSSVTRPIVCGRTTGHTRLKKLGRGFTYDELKSAGIRAEFADSIGVALDHRRINRSLATLKLNTSRLITFNVKCLIRLMSSDEKVREIFFKNFINGKCKNNKIFVEHKLKQLKRHEIRAFPSNNVLYVIEDIFFVHRIDLIKYI